MIQVCLFWTERKRFEDQRRTRILPPNRRHLINHPIAQLPSRETSTSKPIDFLSQINLYLPAFTDLSGVQTTSRLTVHTEDQSLSQNLLLEEKRLEEEEAREDALLASEPEMVELTATLIRAGWIPPSSLQALIAHTSSQTLNSSMSPSKITPNVQKVSPAVVRRRRRLRAQWLDEQPRPFTPIHLNICRPGLSQDLLVYAEKSRLIDVSERIAPGSVGDVDTTESHRSKAHDQLPAMSEVFLPERLTKYLSTGTVTDFGTVSEYLEKAGSADQVWCQFVCGVDRTIRPRTRSRKMSLGTASNHRSLYSAKSCRTDRADMLDQRTPSAKSIDQRQSINRFRFRSDPKQLSDSKDSAHTNTTQSASTPSSSVVGPPGRSSTNTQSEDESGSTARRMSSVNSIGPETRQRIRADENDEGEELILTTRKSEKSEQPDIP
ncbi:hypothetical protein FBUS_04806 [Fasciolopsis buskii]|uniref:Uncharacterized protein n=1 Tax=Fasciolopsis buskii TaxID=27845 RepID=A0A8E0VHJ6_9TREM|nr:hypothetical protein FBUS_04806 [Fasciolopsis buski]